jgi:hypothetical protein
MTGWREIAGGASNTSSGNATTNVTAGNVWRNGLHEKQEPREYTSPITIRDANTASTARHAGEYATPDSHDTK